MDRLNTNINHTLVDTSINKPLPANRQAPSQPANVPGQEEPEASKPDSRQYMNKGATAKIRSTPVVPRGTAKADGTGAGRLKTLDEMAETMSANDPLIPFGKLRGSMGGFDNTNYLVAAY